MCVSIAGGNFTTSNRPTLVGLMYFLSKFNGRLKGTTIVLKPKMYRLFRVFKRPSIYFIVDKVIAVALLKYISIDITMGSVRKELIH